MLAYLFYAREQGRDHVIAKIENGGFWPEGNVYIDKPALRGFVWRYWGYRLPDELIEQRTITSLVKKDEASRSETDTSLAPEYPDLPFDTESCGGDDIDTEKEWLIMQGSATKYCWKEVQVVRLGIIILVFCVLLWITGTSLLGDLL